MALHYSKGEIDIGKQRVIKSIIGSKFIGRVVAKAKFGCYDSVIPEVEGNAFITGRIFFI
jgi:proline racemase